MSDQERLREIAEREQQATKGPWADGDAAWFRGRTNPEHGKRPITAGDSGVLANVYGSGNAKFISAAREDVPYLLSLVSRQAQEIQELRAEREKWQVAYENIDKRGKEAWDYCQRNAKGRYGRNIWHVVLEDALAAEAVSSSRDALREALVAAREFILSDYTRSSLAAGNWPTVKPFIERMDAVLADSQTEG